MSKQAKSVVADDLDVELEALLAPAATDSIVDQLLTLSAAMAGPEDSDPWSRAVSSRLESFLAQKMRSMIESDARNVA